VDSGTVWVNQHLTMTGAPFGGFKSSGLGRELGKADVVAFTEPQTLMLAKTDKVPSAKL
jgi:phenylacetaldehyde dehydrogenase